MAAAQDRDAPEREGHDRAAQIARFKQLTEQVLPLRARQLHWPLRLDHCFKRVCLDGAFGDVWYKHVAKPAERHLRGEPLARALLLAEQLAAGDASLLAVLNRDSLRYCGKLRGG